MKKMLIEDLVLLEKRIEEIDRQLFALGEEFNEAVNQSSETWHDNAPFDAARDRQSILQYERTKLLEIRRNSTTHTVKNSKLVDVGKTVEIQADKPIRIFIAGEWAGRKLVNGATVVSSISPVAQMLIGKKVGDTVMLQNSRHAILSVE